MRGEIHEPHGILVYLPHIVVGQAALRPRDAHAHNLVVGRTGCQTDQLQKKKQEFPHNDNRQTGLPHAANLRIIFRNQQRRADKVGPWHEKYQHSARFVLCFTTI